MKDLLALLGTIALFAAGLLSIVSFSIAMLAQADYFWLVVGWFAGPITVVVWPAILGAWWSGWFYAALVLGGALAAWGRDHPAY